MSWDNRGKHNDYQKNVRTDREKRNEELDRNWINSLPCVNCPIVDICKGVGGFPRPNYNSEFFINNIICKKKEMFRRADERPKYPQPPVYEGTAADSGNPPPSTGSPTDDGCDVEYEHEWYPKDISKPDIDEEADHYEDPQIPGWSMS
jgi:hypothetical protein